MKTYEVLFFNRNKMTVTTTDMEDVEKECRNCGQIKSIRYLYEACDRPDAWIYGYSKQGVQK